MSWLARSEEVIRRVTMKSVGRGVEPWMALFAVLCLVAACDGATEPTVTPAKYTVTSSASSVEVGTQVTFTAQLVDSNGAPALLSGQTVTWSSTGAGGSFASATSLTNESGVATVTFTLDTQLTSGILDVTAAGSGVASGSVQTLVVPGPATKISFAQDMPKGGWRVALPSVQVIVQDRYGNRVSSSTGQTVMLSLHANPMGATLTGGSATTTNGTATFDRVVLDKVGSGYTLDATSGTLTGATSSAFDIDSVGVVATTTDDLIGIAAANATVFFSTRGASCDCARLSSVDVTGGPVTTANLASTPSRPIGPVIFDGMDADVLVRRGGATPSGAIYRGGPGNVLEIGNLLVGPDFNSDGSYFYVPYSSEAADPATTRVGVLQIKAIDGTQMKVFEYVGMPGPVLMECCVYYIAAGAVQRQRPGDPPHTLAGLLGSTRDVPRSIVGVNSISRLYWVEYNSGGQPYIRRSEITKGATNEIVGPVSAGGTVSNMLFDGTYLYLTADGGLYRYDIAYDISTFTPISLATANVLSVAFDADAVYWATSASGTTTIRKRPR
jgi:hypothetical protein